MQIQIQFRYMIPKWISPNFGDKLKIYCLTDVTPPFFTVIPVKAGIRLFQAFPDTDFRQYDSDGVT